MTPVTVSAVRLVDGKELTFQNLTSVEVTSALSSPALGARFVAAVDTFPGDLGRVTVRHGMRTLFTGQVDKQAASLSPGGRLLTVEARSKGALLLDNEAMPCTLTGVRLTTVFNLFIAPYGFVLYNPKPGGSLPLYTVNKGLSEWEALIGFTRRVYGCTPYLTGDQVVADRPRSSSRLLIGGAGLPFTKVEYTAAPYHVLSKVVLRDVDGRYSSAVHNSSAAYYGVQRKRYVIPANEFVDNPALDANQRIRRSMLQKDKVSVTLPGIVQAEIGREVYINDDALTLHNLLADEVTWKQDGGGVTTVLTLVSSIYYD